MTFTGLPRDLSESDDRPTSQLVASYLGETLVQIRASDSRAGPPVRGEQMECLRHVDVLPGQSQLAQGQIDYPVCRYSRHVAKMQLLAEAHS